MHPLESYIQALRNVRYSGAGVTELSYYPALANLLSEVGEHLEPKVRCVMNLRNRGGGLPDGGLFTADQLRGLPEGEREHPFGQMPARGVIEVKGTGDDAWLIAEGEQVTRYWDHYRQVLVTNLRDFVLVGQDADDRPAKLERYRLAESEAEFWSAAALPRAFAQRHGERFVEFLRRVMLRGAPLAAPKDLDWPSLSQSPTRLVLSAKTRSQTYCPKPEGRVLAIQ